MIWLSLEPNLFSFIPVARLQNKINEIDTSQGVCEVGGVSGNVFVRKATGACARRRNESNFYVFLKV